MRVLGTAVWLGALMVPAAAVAQDAPAPPTIDCAVDFELLQLQIKALPGAQTAEDRGFEIITVSQPDVWRAEIAFTTRWHPAYPAATIRTFRRQVTGVWTAESKSCGYGDQQQFAALVEQMKARDKELTDASRAEVERQRQSTSPLAPPH